MQMGLGRLVGIQRYWVYLVSKPTISFFLHARPNGLIRAGRLSPNRLPYRTSGVVKKKLLCFFIEIIIVIFDVG